jgi:hypothetical protein
MTSSAAVLVALLSAGPLAAAETPAAKARLHVSADAACTTRDELAARIAARSSRIQFVDDAPVDVQVTLTSTRPGSVVAELVLTAPGAEQRPRRVVARSCAEAADAVALIIALTLDPTALARAAEPPPPVTQSPPPATPAPPRTDATPPAASAPTRRQFGVSIAGQTIFGAAPDVMPGVALYAMVALERAGWWAPALVVGATHVWRGDLAQQGGRASFTLDAASLDLCPLRLRWAWLEARPCAAALVGRMSARGSYTEQGASASRPFAVAGAAVTAGVGSTIELSLRLAVGLTVIRDAYEFASDVFYRAGPVTASASLGVGWRWR